MKTDRFIIVAVASLMSFALAACPGASAAGRPACGNANEAAAALKPGKKLVEVKFSVSMHCAKCVEKITENISFEKGVKDLEVSLEDKTVKIVYDSSKTDEAKLAESIRKLGYEVGKLQGSMDRAGSPDSL